MCANFRLWASPRSWLLLIVSTSVLWFSVTGVAQDTTLVEDTVRNALNMALELEPGDYALALDSLNLRRDSGIGIPLPLYRQVPGQWHPIGPFGATGAVEIQGRCKDICWAPSGGGHDIVVATSSGGVWRSPAPYSIWTDIGYELDWPAIGAVAHHPTADEIVCATGDQTRYGGVGEIYRSQDGGNTWNLMTRLGTDPPSFRYASRVYYLSNPNELVLSTTTGIWKSTTAGDTWTQTLSAQVTDLVVGSNTEIQYACAADFSSYTMTVYKSTDGGDTWSAVSGAPACQIDCTSPCGCGWLANQLRGSMAIRHGTDTDMVLFLTRYRCTGPGDAGWKVYGVFKTNDGWNSWSDITPSDVLPLGEGQLFHCQAVAIHPSSLDSIYLGAVQLMVTEDGGSSWMAGSANHGINWRHGDITRLAFRPGDEDSLWILNDGGIYVHELSSGITHSVAGNSTTGLSCFQFDFLDADRGFIVGGLQDNGIVASIDGGATWTWESGGDGGDVEITDPINHKWWFSLGASPWMLYRKQIGDAGITAIAGMEDTYIVNLFFDRWTNKIYTFCNIDSIFVGDAPDGPAEITPHHWQRPPSGNGKAFMWGNFSEGKTLFSSIWHDAYLMISRETGVDWTVELGAPIGTDTNWMVTAVAASPQYVDEFWVGLAGASGAPKIYHTDNLWRTGGVTDITNELGKVGCVRAIVVTPFNQDVIYAATDVGVFRTTDGGQEWEAFMVGLPVIRCQDMRYLIDTTHTGHDKLIVATYGRGIWECEIEGPPIVFVDKRNTGPIEDGTRWYPFNTLDEAIVYAPDGSIVAIHGDSYPVPTPPVVGGKHLLFKRYVSSAIIGGS